MRLLYLCADRGVPVAGTKGASVHLRGVARALARRGHEVRVVAAVDGRPPATFPLPVLEIGYDRMLKSLRQVILEADASEVLARETHGLLLNLQVVEVLHGLEATWPVEAIYERFSLWSLAGLRFARQRGIPWVLEVNAPLVQEQRRYRELSLEPVALGLERMLLREADGVVAPAAELRAYIHRRVGRRRRVLVVPNGVDPELFTDPRPPAAPAFRRLRGRYVVAFLGSLKPWHGINLMLGAFARLRAVVPEAHLLVIGDGPLRRDVERAAARLGRGAVTLTGAVPHEEVPGWLTGAHVGVAPYPPLPGFYFSPLKVVEYMAAGLPVVASAIGQVAELVRHEATGLLVPPGNREALAAALERLHRDPRLRTGMGRRARRRALSRHSWDGVAGRIEALLERCRRARSRRTAGSGSAGARVARAP